MSILKKKRVSKKNKASWRKHADIKDIEEFLEEQQLDERIGVISDKKNHELFTIDSGPGKLLSAKERRKANARKPPKFLTALENPSRVQDPHPQRDRVKQKKNGRDLFAEVLNPKSQKIVQANKDRMKAYAKHDVPRNKANKIFQNDAWAEKDALDKHSEFKNDWITRDLAIYHLKNTGKPLVKVHDSIRHKRSRAKAFPPPHPGMSYNPSLKDHQDLVQKVVEKETAIIKEENHLKRVTTTMFSKVTEEERDMERLRELASGLPAEDNDDIEENQESTEPYQSVNPPVQNKKKDKKARRKQKEQKELLRKRQEIKAQKKQTTDIHRLRKLKSEVLQEEKELNDLKKRAKITKEKRKSEPKRIAKLKFKDPEIDVNMAQDIAGNLRNLKPEGHLLSDRFKSLQKRNILVPTVDGGIRKRKKIKRFVRSSHKELPQTCSKKKK